MISPLLKLKLFTLFTLLCASISFTDIVLYSHAFGGEDTDELNDVDVDVFYSGVATEGGSSTWVASTDFKADGSVSGGGDDAARLYLGDYITNRMGTAAGKFSLTATLNPTSGTSGDFLSLGYFTGAIALDKDFASDGSTNALGTAITRIAPGDSSEYFYGPGPGGSINAITGTGLRTFTLVFDFTPESGYDGVTNNGTITFHSDNDLGVTTSYTYNGYRELNYIGLTRDDGVMGDFSNFEFTQIPEPSTLLLLLVAGMGFVVLRRR